MRNVSGGSVESGSSAWGTLASKSILSGSSSKKDKNKNKDKDKDTEGRGGLKEKKKEKTLEREKDGGKPKPSKREREIDQEEMMDRPGQPGSIELQSVASASQIGGASSTASVVNVEVDSDISGKNKPKRGGKKKRPVPKSDLAQPDPDPASPRTANKDSQEPIAQELWSEWSQVQSQLALSSAAGVSGTDVTGMSVAEMVSQQKKDKGGRRGRGKKTAREDRTQQGEETATEVTGMTNDGQDLTVTEMVMRARAEEARARKAEAQREKRKRAATRKLAERQQAQNQVGGEGPVASDVNVEEDQSKAEHNFRAYHPSNQGFRSLGGTSETTRGSSRGTTTDSGVLLPDRPVDRQTKSRGSKKQVSRGLSSDTASQVNLGPGGSSSASFTRPNSSADVDPLYSGYLVVDPSDGAGSTNEFKAFSSTENESVAPHHSVSRRGSFAQDIDCQEFGSASAVIIGLESLGLTKAPTVSVKPSPSRKQTKLEPHTQTTSAQTISHTALPILTNPSARTEHGGSHNDGDDDNDAHSITSYEEAHSSVRAYLANDPEFLADERNKLYFWQGLCIEVSRRSAGILTSRGAETDQDHVCCSLEWLCQQPLEIRHRRPSLSPNRPMRSIFITTHPAAVYPARSSSRPRPRIRARRHPTEPPWPTTLPAAPPLVPTCCPYRRPGLDVCDSSR